MSKLLNSIWCQMVNKFKSVFNKSQVSLQCPISLLEASILEDVQTWLLYTMKANLNRCWLKMEFRTLSDVNNYYKVIISFNYCFHKDSLRFMWLKLLNCGRVSWLESQVFSRLVIWVFNCATALLLLHQHWCITCCKMTWMFLQHLPIVPCSLRSLSCYYNTVQVWLVYLF